MSPHVGNFVQDLVEMAKAVETVPVLQAELSEIKQKLDAAEKHNQALEENIFGYKLSIDGLIEKVRSLEVERDDASFRVLEAEDKAHNVLAMAKAARVSLEQMTGLLDPPKPAPEAASIVEGSSAEHPMDTASMTTTQPFSTVSSVNNQDTAFGTSTSEARPYSGKHYYDHPTYISLHDWLDGGGLEEDYH